MEEAHDNNVETTSSGSILPKACENCRIRKIRCNRQLPCSNCETSGIPCRPAVKSTEHRSRVLLSANYEKQIEQINDRLSGIEDVLKGLQLENPIVSPKIVLDSTPISTSTTDAVQTGVESPATFEGASSFASQAITASQAAEISLGKLHASADIADALISLRDLIKPPSTAKVKRETRIGFPGTPRHTPDMPLLPAAFVLSLLQEFRTRHCATFLVYSFRNQRAIEQICQRVYFPTEPVPIAVLTLMNGMILFLLKEMMFEQKYGVCQEFVPQMKDFCDLTERNFHLGIESFDLLASPSLESARALLIASIKAQDEGRPLLCWTLVSSAARQVMSLGYHRKASLRNDPPDLADEKRATFWTLYAIDKNLSLTLGFSSTIQDYDVDAEMFQVSTEPSIATWDKASIAIIELCRIQGLIYQRLYSLEALTSTPELKAQNVNDLSQRLERWYTGFTPIMSEPAYMPHWFFITYGAFDVVYYSLQTTTLRAASPSSSSVEITSACYEAARASLQKHLEFFPAYSSYGDSEVLTTYLCWILLYASWTPLIVVFLHAIASSSKEDVNLLQQVEESLEPVKTLSPQAEQVSSMTKIFCKLATAFIVSNNKSFVGTYNPQEDMVVMPQVDSFGLNQNFMPPPTGLQYPHQSMNHDLVPAFDASEMEGMSMFLGNWLGGNQPVANLWNMDFSENIE